MNHRFGPTLLFLALAALLFRAGGSLAQSGGNPLGDADAAYARQDYSRALELYQQSLKDPKLDPKLTGSIRAKMVACQVNLGANALVSTTLPASTEPASPRHPHAKPQPNEIRTLDIKELGNFEYDPERGGGLPADVKQLTGLHVHLSGFMIPITQADKVTEFALVPSLANCCFGAPPQIQHTIMIHCPADAPVLYYPDLITVDGILKVQEKREDNYTVSLFEVAAKSVKPLDIPISSDVYSGKKGVPAAANSLK